MVKNTLLHNGVTAHRGNCSAYPENTIASFTSAINIGADWVELDIRKTRDGEIVVIHDETTGRIGDICLNISESTYDELKRVDVAFQFRKKMELNKLECPKMSIPLLKDVIHLVKKQNKTRISIQPKINIVGETIFLLQNIDAVDWIGFNDGNVEYMSEVKSINSSIPVFWDTAEDAPCIDEIVKISHNNGFETVVMHESYISEEKIDDLNLMGIQPGAWTINDFHKIKQLIKMGVRRIYTDYPAECLRIYNQQK